MPKLQATPEILLLIANHIYKGEMKNLKILRYKTGQNAGQIFAEYSLKQTSHFEHSTIAKRSQVRDLLHKAAKALADGKPIELTVVKRSSIKEEYNHSLTVWEDSNA